MERSTLHTEGIRLMLQAAFTFSLMTLCVKLVSNAVSSVEIVFFRSLIGLIFIVPLMLYKKVSFTGHFRARLFFRGLSGFLALILFFQTITRLPLGTAVFLNYTSPFFVALFSSVWLGEKIGAERLLLITLSFAGVYLLVDSSLPSWSADVVWGLLSAVLAAGSYVLIRSIRHRESPLTIIFYFTLISTVGSGALCFHQLHVPGIRDLLLLFLVGVTAFVAQIWLTIALRRAPASLISPFSYMTPLLSYLYGILFWGDLLDAKGWAGIALILTGGILISHFGTLKENREPEEIKET